MKQCMISSVKEAKEWILDVGFLPLLKSSIPGFSLYEMTNAEDWWTGDAERDPWEWRKELAQDEKHTFAYGKFLSRNSAFVCRTWLPILANYRRDGYDFDARYEDGLASGRAKAVMDLFEKDPSPRFSYEIKQEAGFGKDGLRGYEGTVTQLQMQTYLCIAEFSQRINKQGRPYGWSVARLCTAESLFGEDFVRSAYREKTSDSFERMRDHLQKKLKSDANSIRSILVG